MKNILVWYKAAGGKALLGMFSYYLLMQAGSLRSYLKYPLSHIPAPLALALWLVIIAAGYVVLAWGIEYLGRVPHPGRYLAVLFLLAAAVALIVYPVADGLKTEMRGSDQDDCVIASIHNLLHGMYPYSRSYLGNLCSTGFGMLVLYLPFTALSVYALGSVAAILALYGFLHQYETDKRVAWVFVLALFSSLLVWELMVVGSDLIMLGCAMALGALLLEKALKERNSGMFLGAALLWGLAASSRINFVVLPVILALMNFKHGKKSAIFLALSMLVAILPSLIIYMRFGELAPLHLLGKGADLLPGIFKLLSAGALLLATLYAILACAGGKLDAERGLLLVLFAMLAPVSLGGLVQVGGNFAEWEGANYLLPMLPLAAILFSRRYTGLSRLHAA